MNYHFYKELVIIFQDEGGIIFDPRSEEYFGLDYVGVIICRHIEAASDFHVIINDLCNRFDVKKETAQNDLNEFINQLLERKLLYDDSNS